MPTTAQHAKLVPHIPESLVGDHETDDALELATSSLFGAGSPNINHVEVGESLSDDDIRAIAGYRKPTLSDILFADPAFNAALAKALAASDKTDAASITNALLENLDEEDDKALSDAVTLFIERVIDSPLSRQTSKIVLDRAAEMTALAQQVQRVLNVDTVFKTITADDFPGAVNDTIQELSVLRAAIVELLGLIEDGKYSPPPSISLKAILGRLALAAAHTRVADTARKSLQAMVAVRDKSISAMLDDMEALQAQLSEALAANPVKDWIKQNVIEHKDRDAGPDFYLMDRRTHLFIKKPIPTFGFAGALAKSVPLSFATAESAREFIDQYATAAAAAGAPEDYTKIDLYGVPLEYVDVVVRTYLLAST